MNDEEKKALEQLKYMNEDGCEKCVYGEDKTCINCWEAHKEIILNLIEKQDKIINKYKTVCKQHIAFCRIIRQDYKHDVDNFNQGQEYKCTQFLSLLDGEKNWTYEGKYFDEHDRQIEELNKVGE